MNREILDTVRAHEPQSAASVEQSQETTQRPIPSTELLTGPVHALANAFPAWDLIPAAPFVRRVK